MLSAESAHRRSDREQLNNRPLIGLLSQVLRCFAQHASPFPVGECAAPGFVPLLYHLVN